MNTYWKDYQGDDESLWAHEWNKHGTCISSFEPKCYSNHDLQQGVVDYFVKTTEVFSELRSFIVRIPVSYQILQALLMQHFILVFVRCRHSPE